MQVAVFGLGEAGSEICRDLAAAGATVAAFDPASVPTPDGIERFEDPAAAVAGAELVLAVTAGADAPAALAQARHAIRRDTIYADLSSSAPARKRELAEAATGLRFVDVALMSTVPGKGIATPMLAAGDGARAFAELLSRFGASVDVVGTEPGAAATRKLLRSVVVKGVAAVLIESLRAAHEADLAVATWQNVMRQLADADEAFIRRLVEGTGPHAARRRDEMAAAVELLDELGVPSAMTRATVQNLETVRAEGLPPIPES